MQDIDRARLGPRGVGQPVAVLLPGLCHGLGGITLRVVEIAEEAATGAAVVHAGRLLAILETCDAAVTLLDNALALIIAAGGIRTGVHAQLAANAGVGINHDKAILVLAVGCTSGADLEAGGILTLLALARQPVLLDIGESAHGHSLHAIPAHSQVETMSVLARNDAGVAAAAAVQVNNKAVSH